MDTLNAHPYTVAIIQARMSSSRLPGKVLLDIGGQPMLVRVVERTRRSRLVHQVIVATTTDASDEPIESLCIERGYACARGSLLDVLDRYYQAARQAQAEVIVRVTADCPVIDPQVIDKTIQAYFQASTREPGAALPFVANRLPPPWGRTYPIGLDTEVCSFTALEQAWREARQPHQREHVMPFFYEQPERFAIILVNHEQDLGALRWTVDTAEDLDLLRRIYAHFNGRDDFSWLDVLRLVNAQRELSQINANVQHKHYKETDERSQPNPKDV